MILKGVWIAFNEKKPRLTQMISFWFNVHSTKTILEIKTGEGKTMIVGMTALYYALQGKKVDVFTSSAPLAETEVLETSSVKKLMNIFRIKLGSNCEKLDDRALAYENQVIYGTA